MRAGKGGGGGGWVGLPVTKLRYRTLQDESWALSRSVGGFSNKIIISSFAVHIFLT